MIESYGISDVGMVRPGNEDNFKIDDQIGLYIVSDGMGGHLAGEVASQIVVDSIHGYIKKYKAEGLHESLLYAPYDDELSEEANVVQSSINLANRMVLDISRKDKDKRKMGATVAILFFGEGRTVVANVGDSRIYLIRQNTINTVTRDHTLASDQAYEHIIEPNEVESSPYKHILTRVIGVDEEVKPDIFELEIVPGDRFLLCSDGLTNMVADDEIMEVITAHKRPEKICQVLVDMANQKGGEDNITVALVHYKHKPLERIFSFFSKPFKRGLPWRS
nr:Stp1/IreP family PP2C-type Ser/Thr phosphatase [Desulfobacterales bacterium]